VSIATRLRTVEPEGIAERLRLAFFRAFVPLLLLGVAVSEWAVIAWLLPQAGVAVPAAAHVGGPAALWLVNRAVAVRSVRGRGVAAALLRGWRHTSDG
jgi:hypothetical protein